MININKWKPFRLGDTKYFTIKRGESEYLKNMFPGEYPYISTTKDNNGIISYVSEFNREGGLISLAYDGSIGACFYQSSHFFASEKIVTINTVQTKLNENLALFLITIIHLEAQLYSYGGRKWTVDQQLKNTSIYLPTDEFGEPDYKYMEKYIEKMEFEAQNIPDYFLNEGYKKACWYLDNINQQEFEQNYAGTADNTKISLSDRKWNYFQLEKIVSSVHNGKAYNSSDLVVSDSEEYVLYVTRTDKNNGVSMYVQALDYQGLEKANAITIGDTTATIFFQEHNFITGPHIIVIRADWLNVYTANFIITILNREKYRYPVFGRAFTKDLIKQTKLYLPIDDDGNPDYKFMEDYIKSLPFSNKI